MNSQWNNFNNIVNWNLYFLSLVCNNKDIEIERLESDIDTLLEQTDSEGESLLQPFSEHIESVTFFLWKMNNVESKT